MLRMSSFILKNVLEKQMKTKKFIGSLPNMEIPQLPVSLLSHMEAMGLLPISHEDDGVNNIDIPWRSNTNYFRRDVLDENNEPLF
jgi:hypothetical protein|tara:strand:- start:282 stop:536 length:255 start_codon:yes stop_codon:yes gene_type:complete